MTTAGADGQFVSPSFENPPLLEVALAVEFAPIAEFGAVAMAELARRWRDRYPHVEEHPPLPPGPALGTPTASAVMVNVGAPQIRLWLLTESRDRLVQIQRDRLVVNWRATGNGGMYPRYADSLRPEFERDVSEFFDMTSRAAGQPLQPTTTEVTYVNLVATTDRTDFVGILRSQKHVDHHLGQPTASAVNQFWNRYDDDGLVGSLTISGEANGDRTMFTISSRAVVARSGAIEAVLSSLDVAHEDVVTAFVELTTSSAQSLWRRTS